MSLGLNVSDEVMQSIIAKSILETITPEKREELLKGAIQVMITRPPKGTYDRNQPQSPLQDAFNGAVDNTARQIAREYLEKDEGFQAQVKQLFAEAAEKLFSPENRNKIVESLADTLRAGLKIDRY